MTSDNANPAGLRARKRQETRDKLEEATLYFVKRDGLENATIELISERAGVSARTFFNYFDTKEEALLGLRHLELDEAKIAAHAESGHSDDAVESIIRLLFLIAGPILADVAAHQERAEIVKRYPQLVAIQLGQLAKIGEGVVASTIRILADDPRWADADPREGSAVLLLSLCSTAMRFVTEGVLAEGGALSVPDLERKSIATVRAMLSRLD